MSSDYRFSRRPRELPGPFAFSDGGEIEGDFHAAIPLLAKEARSGAPRFSVRVTSEVGRALRSFAPTCLIQKWASRLASAGLGLLVVPLRFFFLLPHWPDLVTYEP
jgi:hypothetical protein